MIILPDTIVWINLLNLKDTPIAERFRKEKAERIKLCSPSVLPLVRTIS